jgi:DNA polymerase/3'-5' exonuclease PolX
MINDALVKQIEAHLAGVSRLSDEYGIDHLYEIDKKRRDEQIFDERGYSEYKEAETLEKMSQYDRQQELLFRRKVH